MEVIKLFKENNVGIPIQILGDQKNPLFRASDIGIILEFSNIKQTIMNYDETKKIKIKIDTPGGKQDVLFLTENGLYEVLFLSKSPLAEKFKKEIIKNSKDKKVVKKVNKQEQEQEQEKQEKKELETLKKQLEEKDKQLENKDKQIYEMKPIVDKYINSVNKFDISNFIGKSVVYLIDILETDSSAPDSEFNSEVDPEKRLYEYGHTSDIRTRFSRHRKTFGSKDIKIIKCWDCHNISLARNIEQSFKYYVDNHNMRGKSKKTSTDTEIVSTDDLNFIISVIDKMHFAILEAHENKFKDARLTQVNETTKSMTTLLQLYFQIITHPNYTVYNGFNFNEVFSFLVEYIKQELEEIKSKKNSCEGTHCQVNEFGIAYFCKSKMSCPEHSTGSEEEKEGSEGSEEENVEEFKEHTKKCGRCGKKLEFSEFDINPQTNDYYTQCNICRVKQSKTTKEKNFDGSKKIDPGDKTLYKCCLCKLDKLYAEYGFCKKARDRYKTCKTCRDRLEKNKLEKQNKRDKDEEDEDSKDDKDKVKVDKDEEEDVTESESESESENYKIIEGEYDECNTCPKKFPRTFKMFKNGNKILLKNCEECREKRKPHDKKKTIKDKEKISKRKKKYYVKNKDPIRQDQKIRYDENKQNDLIRKKKNYEEKKKKKQEENKDS
jgi:prophage antirepressor-like protein